MTLFCYLVDFCFCLAVCSSCAVVTTSSASLTKASSLSQMNWQLTDSPRESSNEICPDGLALKKRILNFECNTNARHPDVVNHPSKDSSAIVSSSDIPSYHHGQSMEWPVQNAVRFDILPHQQSLSSASCLFEHGSIVSGSPRFDRRKNLCDDAVACQCGSCIHCLTAAARRIDYDHSMYMSSVSSDVPLNLSVSSGRAPLQASSSSTEWRQRQRPDSSGGKIKRQTVVTPGERCYFLS